MIRRHLVVIALVVTVTLASGCAQPQVQTVVDPALKKENTDLKQRLGAVEGERADLQQKLKASDLEYRTAKLDAEKWQTLYEEAKASLPAEGGALPPELLKKFIEIARAGGPFELGHAGSLKASADILFDPGKAVLKPAGEAAVKDIASKLKEILTDKRVMLRVDGHTDNTPIRVSGWDSNLHLSLMRAKAVVKVLEQQGIPPGAMFAAGFGEWHPVAANTNKEGQAKNRRVELSLIAVAPLVPEIEPGVEP